ncbi:UNVERIFIED_CONTAM: Zinc finger CCCH domain-containing protein 44 [Sesamum radiatum]|uniref:Zinc finger CCCH domain-containing protein 44 n=1 Tax=Sesamum radiatum TaxID=300843 RepID=A0AAW2RDX0_SESRA
MENIETLLAAVAQTQGFDDDEPVASTAAEVGLEDSESSPVVRGEISGLQLTGEVSRDARPSAVVDTPPPAQNPAFSAVGHVIGAGARRKRGRPPKGQLAAKPPPPKRNKQEDEEEDVCFICFDGGSLVLCDRNVLNFFGKCLGAVQRLTIRRVLSGTKHISNQKQSGLAVGTYVVYVGKLLIICVTLAPTHCARDAEKMQITYVLEETKVQVDFDDKSSWEYLFKAYWVHLKEKLSLTLSELTQAKKPSKGVAAAACQPQLNDVLHTAVDGKISISYRSTEHLELNKPHVEINLLQSDGLATALSSIDNHGAKVNRDQVEDGQSHSIGTVKQNIDEVTDEPSTKKATYKPSIEKNVDYPTIVKDSDKPCICSITNSKEPDKPSIDCTTEWASKDVVEFVAHMKNGDTSAISQFDVQTLLLEYIKRHNLQDPRKKSQIICDPRLKNLFGKPCVGHIEMLKLLDYHFLIKEDSQKNSLIPAGFVGSIATDMEVDGNIFDSSMPSNSRKPKMRIKCEERAPQNDLDEYAAIDVHNINLIYLRRNLMEHLIEDKNFNDKVIGSIVRIRISSNDQKPDVYRLVQVLGIRKVAEPYNIGNRTADVMLEVLNLDIKEVVSIDAISIKSLPRTRCKRKLWHSNQSGSMIAPSLSAVIQSVGDLLADIVLLCAPLGVAKQEIVRLREYMDKLQLLKSPAELHRRLSEVPEIHADPKMSPHYESEEDARSGEDSTKGKEEQCILMHSRLIEKTDARGSNSSDKPMDEVNSTNLAIGGRNDQAMQRTSELSHKPSSGSQEHGASADESGSSWPRCWDLLKDNNSSADNVQVRNLLPSSSSETYLALPDRGQESDEVNHASQDGEKSSSGLTTSRMTSEHELQNQSNNEDQLAYLLKTN